MTDSNFVHLEDNLKLIGDARLKAVAKFIYEHRESFDYGMIAEFVNSNNELKPIARQRVSNLTKSLANNFGFEFKAPLVRGGSYQLVKVNPKPIVKNKSDEESQELFRAAFSLMGGGQ